ncbi:MgtC/SapB family protein [Candidatus Woesearchaeota archaeon]|nr:MgtC/SapB family protein [Candidatus Woesearchaeota archaeon]
MVYNELLIKFGLTFIFAVLFGLERQKAHKPIGFGTFIFVAMGSCALGIVAYEINRENPLPLLAAIVTGIGFLGAGALIRTSDKIFGFTSAAAIWVFAIIGLSLGVGLYLISTILYVSVWAIILIDKHLERLGIGTHQKRVTLAANRVIKDKEIEAVLGTKKYRMLSMEISKKTSLISIILLVEGTRESINQIPTRLYGKDWVDSYKIE